MIIIDTFLEDEENKEESDVMANLDYEKSLPNPPYGTRSNGPDLIVSRIYTSYGIEFVDHNTVLHVEVTNIGNEDIEGLSIWLKTDINFETVIDDIIGDTLLVDESITATYTWADRIEDNYLIQAEVDHMFEIEEQDEENNMKEETIGVFTMHSNTGLEKCYHYSGGELNVLRSNNIVVNSIDGNLYILLNDIGIKAYQFNLGINRIYNSQRNNILSPLGYGWTFNHDTHLDILAGGHVNYIDMDGSRHAYLKSGSNFITPVGQYDKLKIYVGGDYKLFKLDGSVTSFDSSGKITEIEDKNGNKLTYHYNGTKLTSINDTNNLSLTFEYNNDDLIKTISDPINRAINFYYDEGKNLTNVSDPNGNNVSYTYDDAHRLISLKNRVNTVLNFTYKIAKVISGEPRRDHVYQINSSHFSSDPTEGQQFEDKTTIYTFNYRTFNTTIINPENISTYVTYNMEGNPQSISGPVEGLGYSEGTYGSYNYKIFNYTDPLGKTTYYEYDEYDNLENETDPSGNVTKLRYKVTDIFEGETEKYISLLNNMTDKMNNTWNYGYYDNGNLKNITDPTNYTITFNYSASGLLTEDNGIPKETFSYDSSGNLNKVTFEDNTSMEYTYNAIGWINTTKNKNGHITYYEYNNNGNLIKVIDPLGYNISYIYDNKNRIISETDKLGFTTNYTYNSTNGQIARVTDPLNNTETFKYDSFGNLIEYINKNAISTYYKYDNSSRKIEEKDCYNYTITWEYDSTGNIIKETDKNNATIQYVYNSVDERTQIIDPSGNITYSSYDEEGQTISETNARNYTTNYTYDSAGRVVNTTDALGNVTTNVYNSNGTLIQEIFKDKTTKNYTYDNLNRLISVTDSRGTVTYTYDNLSNILTETNPLNHTTKFEYDVLGRLINITSPLNLTTTSTYDANNRVISIKDANGNYINYTYDALGRKTKETSASGKNTTYEYDAVGNLVNRTDPNGNKTRYHYDNLNRLINISYPDNTSVTFSYELMGRINQSHNNGIGANDSFYYTYNINGQLIKLQLKVYNNTFEIEYEYDEVGNTIKVTDPNNGTTLYQYDALNRIIKITSPYDKNITFEYNNMDRVINLTYANGIKLTNIINNKGWLEKEDYIKIDQPILNVSYTYDSIGRIIRKIDINGTTNYTYDNESRLISVSYPWGKIVSYTYDNIGNRINMTDNGVKTNYSYDNENQLLNISDSTSYVYDVNGNMIRKINGNNITNYSYDYENRLIKIIFSNNSVVEYYYYSFSGENYEGISPNNIFGNRFAKIINNSSTYYFYNGMDLIIEWNETFVCQVEYTHGPDIDDPLIMHLNNQNYYYIKGHINSIISIANENGNLIQNYTYDAWGTIISQTGSLANPFTYTGREYDPESGLYYYRARYYSNLIGRFIQKDPKGLVDGPNLYIYGKNNPIINVDPSGTRSWIINIGSASKTRYDYAEIDCHNKRVLWPGTYNFGKGRATNIYKQWRMDISSRDRVRFDLKFKFNEKGRRRFKIRTVAKLIRMKVIDKYSNWGVDVVKNVYKARYSRDDTRGWYYRNGKTYRIKTGKLKITGYGAWPDRPSNDLDSIEYHPDKIQVKMILIIQKKGRHCGWKSDGIYSQRVKHFWYILKADSNLTQRINEWY
jgi:RHS repeat-associated protein